MSAGYSFMAAGSNKMRQPVCGLRDQGETVQVWKCALYSQWKLHPCLVNVRKRLWKMASKALFTQHSTSTFSLRCSGCCYIIVFKRHSYSHKKSFSGEHKHDQCLKPTQSLWNNLMKDIDETNTLSSLWLGPLASRQWSYLAACMLHMGEPQR